MYVICLQHIATRQEYIVKDLINVSPSVLYYQFNRFRMPVGAPDGEYRCALIWDGRDDSEYVLSDDLLETTIKTGEGDIQLKYLRPEVFLMRYGSVEDCGIVIEKNTGYVVYKRK